MMAPYAIAHMKVGLKLVETGYDFSSDERARIYLTNALEPWHKQLQLPELDALAHEAAAVNEIKRQKRFTVVIGNPPYALYSGNMTADARRLVDDYRFVLGIRIRERGALQLEKNLQDDYVKFFAVSERWLSHANAGVLAFISNHGYLGNKSLRGMREHLLRSFNKISVIDLHGSVSRARGGLETDQNVFDIQQGVAIGIFARTPENKMAIRHFELRGSRESKYHSLSSASSVSFPWREIAPEAQEYFFLPFNSELRSEYNQYYALSEAMPINSSGMVTARDAVTIWHSKAELLAFLDRFGKMSPSVARKEFKLGDDTKDWSVERAQRDVGTGPWSDDKIVQVLYRPFDLRWTLYTGQARGFLCNPRRPVLQHVLRKNNIALLVNRQVNNDFRHSLVSHALVDTCTLSSATRETAYIFPLMLFNDGELALSGGAETPNFASNFLKKIAEFLRLPLTAPHGLPQGVSAECIFNYSYAILNSNSYRARYREFLKLDFPRLPLTENLELFLALAKLGGEITALHLLESTRLNIQATEYVGIKNPEIEKASWSNNTVWVDKAQTTGFKGVPENVWSFHIGGYQVCEKWLKDRKGRTLSMDDISHYQKIIVALSETIRLMGEIDNVIDQHGGWPNAFSTN